jgi:hypothetical protein
MHVSFQRPSRSRSMLRPLHLQKYIPSQCELVSAASAGWTICPYGEVDRVTVGSNVARASATHQWHKSDQYCCTPKDQGHPWRTSLPSTAHLQAESVGKSSTCLVGEETGVEVWRLRLPYGEVRRSPLIEHSDSYSDGHKYDRHR